MDLSGHEGEIPLPISSTYVVHHSSSTGPPPSLPSTRNSNITEDSNANSSKKQQLVVANNKVVRYRECLKNHAASMGGTATDGCGEFMPSGEEGTFEALKCSACTCHRNFHRKEIEGEPSSCHHDQLHHYNYKPGNAFAAGYLPSRLQPPALIMPLGAIQTSESDEMEDGYGFGGGGGGGGSGGGEMGRGLRSHSVVKKRFRTKFTQEQKEKMLSFAEKVGWKLQRQEEGLVQQFCQEIGVKRRVLKVWMHNNKHNLAKKQGSSTPPHLQ